MRRQSQDLDRGRPAPELQSQLRPWTRQVALGQLSLVSEPQSLQLRHEDGLISLACCEGHRR